MLTVQRFFVEVVLVNNESVPAVGRSQLVSNLLVTAKQCSHVNGMSGFIE